MLTVPSPDKFKDIDIACKRIKKAILGEKETITIVGDYDVDGVVSTTIMLDFFNYYWGKSKSYYSK